MSEGYKEKSLSPPADQLWDVAIVGAGPAGSTAAIHLVSHGHSVLLIDKEEFPRDKICGDGLIADSINALKRIGLYDRVHSLSYETDTGAVFSPSQIRFDITGQFLTLKRFLLDDLIARKAIECGAQFLRRKVLGARAQPDSTVLIDVDGSSEAIRSKIVFLATGANVELASSLGLTIQPGPSAVALRCYARSRFKVDQLVISYDRSITPGYAWIFPLGNNEYNIGCGIRYRENDSRRANLRLAFKDFIRSFPMAASIFAEVESVTQLRGAMLRCGLTGARALGPGNILLIGEMIGATFPFTGEGIGKAMESGEIAADVAHQAMESGDFSLLSHYAERIERELKPKYLGYRLAEDWLSHPWLNDLVARRITRSRYLRESVTGIVNETVDPRDVFSLRGVLRSFLG